MASWRSPLLLLGVALAISGCAAIASAGPDPPHVDGGSTTFVGNWTVDPLDDLLYVNQTIVLDGNLTVDENATLELRNCTLVMNSTFNGQFSILVRANGTMRALQGTTVTCRIDLGGPGPGFMWSVSAGGRIVMDGSRLVGAGWDDEYPGLVLEAGGSALNLSSIEHCHRGLTALGGPSTVENLTISNCSVGILWKAPSSVLANVSCQDCNATGVVLEGCADVIVADLTAVDCGEGLRVAADATGIVVRDVEVRGSSIGVNCSSDGAVLQRVSGTDCDVCLRVSGNDTWAEDVRASLTASAPPATAGVLVTGGAVRVRLVTLDISGPDDAILVLGGCSGLRVSDLRVRSVVDGGVAIDASPGRASDVRLERLTLAVAGVSYGIALRGLDGVVVDTADISGPPSYAVDLRDCSDVQLESVQATASQRVISADGSGAWGNLTITGCDLDGAQYGLWSEDVPRLRISDSIFLYSAIDCIIARRVADVGITDCAISGGLRSGIELFSCQGVVLGSITISDVPYPVYMQDTRNITIDGCLADACDTGMWFSGCVNLDMLDTTVTACVLGFAFNASSDLALFTLTAQQASDAGFALEGGTTGAVLDNASIRSCPTGVRLSGAATSSILLRSIDLQNCTEGVNASWAGADIVVNSTAFDALKVGVSATGGSEVRVEDGSFVGCTMALRSDLSSWLNWTVASPTDMEDCSALLRGRIELLGGGGLNITRCDVVFLSRSDLDAGIASVDGSTLRLSGSSFSAGAASAFHIDSSGALDIRDCNVSDGTDATSVGALTVAGDAAWVGSSTFSDCAVAVRITGDFATIAGCEFSGNTYADIVLGGALRPIVSGCDLVVAARGIAGTFDGSLTLSDTYIDGRGASAEALSLANDASVRATLTLRNVTIAHFSPSVPAVVDQHQGSTLLEDCVLLDGVGLSLGPRGGAMVQVRRVAAMGSSVGISATPFLVENCSFNDSLLQLTDCLQGGVVDGCLFEGTPSPAPAMVVLRSRYVTLVGVDVDVVGDALSILDDSSLRLVTSSIICTGIALEVNSSQLEAESTGLYNLSGDGLRASGVSATVELGNCTISANPGRTGHDVVVTSNAEAWLVNTTFDRTSVVTADSGRLHVVWYATFELRPPWGGTVDRPTTFTITDAKGDEVVNVTDVRGVFELHELLEDSGTRTMLTPHQLFAEDRSRGVRWEGELTFDRTLHVTIDLLDMELPFARAGPDQVVVEDSLVTLDGMSSSDNDPTFGMTGTFVWTFDDYGTPVTLSGARVDHVFSVPGSFQITLTVRDGAGNVGTDPLVVQVLDATPPVIVFEGNVSVDEDTPYIFDASATTDNDPRFEVSNGRFVWTFQVPGGPLTVEGAAVIASFPEPGTYAARLTVYDRESNNAEADFWVEVLDRTAPEIVGLRDTVVFAPTPNLLDASRSVDNVGIATYRWVVEHDSQTITLEGPTPQFSFDGLGIYDVTLTLEDAAHNANWTSFAIVYDDVPVITLPSHVVAMALSPLEVTFKVQDEFNDGLAFSLASGPAGVTFSPGPEGIRLLWTPQGGTGGYESMDVMFDVSVNDGYVDAVGRMTVWVNPARGDGNHPPVITSTPPLAAKRAAPYIYSVFATDPDGDRLGYVLVAGPAGMAVSVEGTVSWTPPFETGTIAVHVNLGVTDGQAIVVQEWDIRFREPPNQAPRIAFSIPSLEVKVLEEFTVDLTPFVPDGSAYQVDADDPNLVLSWSVRFNASAVTLVEHEKLVFRFRALEVSAELELEFVVTDPSGANDSTTMGLAILPPPVPGGDHDWWPWMLLVLVVAGVVATVGVGVGASRRRRRLAAAEARIRAMDAEAAEPEQPRFAPTAVPSSPASQAGVVVAEETSVTAASRALTEQDVAVELEEEMLEDDLDELLADMGSFQEIPSAAARPASLRARAAAIAEAATGTPAPPAPPPAAQPSAVSRPFVLEGVAVLGKDGRTLASTGRVDEVIGPVQKAVLDVLAARDATNDATLEVEGRRVIVMARDGMGVVGIIRGREDGDLRPQISAALDNVHAHPDRDGALEVIEDLLAASGGGVRAEVVKGAWTAHLRAHVGFKGHHVVLEVFVRNDTDALMHNVRIDMSYDHDALSLVSVRPRLLVSQDHVSVGNLPPSKSAELEVAFTAELCLSSPMSVLASYTDSEGRRVQVPIKPMRVDVRPPRLAPAGAPTDQELLELAGGGLPHSGRKAFTYAAEVPRAGVHAVAIRKARDAGLAVVRELDSPETMRTETWLAGAAVEGRARAIVRVSAHGADRLLEVFAASDDAAVIVGLLTSLSGTIMDSVGSATPVAALERVKDARLLGDLEVWPTLLEYELEGD